MQTMNVHYGGTLYMDLPAQYDGVDSLTRKPIAHWQTDEPTEAAHYIDVKRGSRLHDILGADSSAANSFHHQGVRVVADGFVPVAYASDGLIEAIEARDKTFRLGVQWHPSSSFEKSTWETSSTRSWRRRRPRVRAVAWMRASNGISLARV